MINVKQKYKRVGHTVHMLGNKWAPNITLWLFYNNAQILAFELEMKKGKPRPQLDHYRKEPRSFILGT